MKDSSENFPTSDLDLVAWLVVKGIEPHGREGTDSRTVLIYHVTPDLQQALVEFEGETTVRLRDYARARGRAKALFFGEVAIGGNV